MKIDVADFFHSLKGDELFFVPNPGNGGDALIAASTYQLLERLNVKYFSADRNRESFAGQIVVYGGGGNLGLMKNFSTKFLQRIHKSVKRLVILPHTIKDISPLLEDFGSNVDIVCRELVSYSYVKEVAKRANVYLAHDMALSLDVQELLLNPPAVLQKLKVASEYFRYKLLPRQSAQAPSFYAIQRMFAAEYTNSKLIAIATDSTLNAFRTDGERTSIQLPLNNVDVSEAIAMGVETKDLAYINSFYFLSFIQKFDLVRTNRLHVCIGALLLGKTVEFHGNNYYKCRAVYDYSLKKFPSLRFVDDGE